MMSSCRASLHREPLKSTSFAYQHVKRACGMHLKPYHKLQKKDSSLEIRSNRGMHLNNQSCSKEEKCNNTTKNCLPSSDNPSRQPLGTISPNTMCNTVGINPGNSYEVRAKNVQPATIHQGEEGESSLDICAIIKPGNTKEKVAFFAAHHCSNIRNNTMKLKNTGDMSGRAAKRRKKSVDLKRVKNQLEKKQEVQKKCFLSEPFTNGVENCSVNFISDSDGMLPGRPLSVIEMVAFLEQRASDLLSDCPKTFTNPTSSKHNGTSRCVFPLPMSLMGLGACEVQSDNGVSEKGEQMSESVCVLEMVAKLESECLRRQNERDSGGLSRSNSFRRNVGRMLLATGSQPNTNSPPKVPSSDQDVEESIAASAMEEHNPQNKEDSLTVNSWEKHAQYMPQATESSPPVEDFYVANVDLELVRETYLKIRSRCDIAITVDPCKFSFSLCIKAVEHATDSESQNTNDCTAEEHAECLDKSSDSTIQADDVLMQTFPDYGVSHTHDKPLSRIGDPCPGTLFFQHDQNNQNHAHIVINSEVKSQTEIQKTNTFDNTLCIQNSSLIAQYAVSVSSLGSVSQVLDTCSVKRQVSHDFLETRFKIQQLLEPQQYMAFLPHHILVKIFRFLPTRSLAALKCTSCYFKFIIEYYDIRPADSLWVRDPRYKDDPCKQCKKKYAKGDVSLCWWHPKPYCQALPYGPGYWMCCHMSHKESPGCKVGLHDNRWVPACHSFNRPICKKSKESESEED
ncbi:F-box only protein 34 [Bombina bombina]|uniref:F-box only protein 34 n=1 Tax=Bombina bombina TaxID=8345 RepID=UPI00235A7C30|nr:F-box only protein 34 [Bombina bombina]XP_053553312.1 F-box only protein 34 [Bombina bombina]XP_053553313.1 F-box only protein 34 [Bombina bombina]XP_053553314.1 F-box only protein 34 [Bombina bombina]XP_053553315.1 F-box only protein 34 [Bombina bombina]